MSDTERLDWIESNGEGVQIYPPSKSRDYWLVDVDELVLGGKGKTLREAIDDAMTGGS